MDFIEFVSPALYIYQLDLPVYLGRLSLDTVWWQKIKLAHNLTTHPLRTKWNKIPPRHFLTPETQLIIFVTLSDMANVIDGLLKHTGILNNSWTQMHSMTIYIL